MSIIFLSFKFRTLASKDTLLCPLNHNDFNLHNVSTDCLAC